MTNSASSALSRSLSPRLVEDTSADLTLSFVENGVLPARLAAALKPGGVVLRGRGDEGDDAVALAPADAGEAAALGAALMKLAAELRAARVAVAGELEGEQARALALSALAAARQDPRYREPRPMPGELAVAGLTGAALARLRGLWTGSELTAALVDTPANELRPPHMAAVARELGELPGVETEVWGRDEVEARGLRLLSAVAAGSEHGPLLLRLTVRGEGPVTRRAALVGKGITFDTGGYSMKTSQGMYGMKTDMGGAAAVLGAVRALAELRGELPDGLEVRAYVPVAENMVGPHAIRPGDIFRSFSGKTVEVTNTDAEGRLILADALTLAEQEGADVLVDAATLTGAKVVALGGDIAALFANDDALAGSLEAAARGAGESVWRLPLHRPYLKTYTKGLADLKNSDGVPAGGAIKAALFLSEFVSKPWAHLDIAGNADREGKATGFGAATLAVWALSGAGG